MRNVKVDASLGRREFEFPRERLNAAPKNQIDCDYGHECSVN
jgi:hypothetical protein